MARLKDLDVWKKSARLSAEIYKELAEIRDYGFRDQITPAGLSVPSNIAEGYERDSNKEVANFLNYAKGSAGELRTQIYIGMTSVTSTNKSGSNGYQKRKPYQRCFMR